MSNVLFLNFPSFPLTKAELHMNLLSKVPLFSYFFSSPSALQISFFCSLPLWFQLLSFQELPKYPTLDRPGVLLEVNKIFQCF